jgi:two-component system phosphate regulon sensor histidine kinase PhoR
MEAKQHVSGRNKSTGGLAARERQTAKRAFWIFLAVALVCVAQAAWWMVYQIGQADHISRMESAQLDLEAHQLVVEMNDELGTLWFRLDSLVSDTAWSGAVPRQLAKHSAVRKVSRTPMVRRSIQMEWGRYDVANWSWAFYGPVDSLYIEVDAVWAASMVEHTNPDFEFRGGAPFPGHMPWSFDPLPVRPTQARLDRIEDDRKSAIVMFASEGTFFVLLIVVGVYMIYRTVRKSAELGRRQHNFVAAVTHELKAPLASVKLYAETLSRPEITSDQRNEYLQRMLQDVARLEHLIDNTLMAGRLEEKGFHLDLKAGDLSQDMAEYVKGLKGFLDRHDFTLQTNIESDIQAVTDYDAMRRVVESLVENAVKYSGDRREAQLALKRDGKHAKLTVTDYGNGIPTDQIDKVFNAFYRVGDEMTRQIKGTGLGLYLVREIVAAHGGEAAIASKGENQGTVVTITLPAAQ